MQKNAQEIADRIDAALAEGVVPWLQPWIGGAATPRNLKTKKPYRGINLLLLALSPHAGHWFVTYKQAKAMGGQVKEGEHGTRIFFWTKWCPNTKGGDVRKCRIPEHKGDRRAHPMILRGYTVFNAETQVDGLLSKIPPRPRVQRHEGDALSIGLKLVDALDQYDLAHGAHEGGNQAYYDPAADLINLPPTETFWDGERYYWAALHELVHSTGHKERLNREQSGGFGSKDYAREELVAEIGSAIGAYTIGFEPNIEQSASYIDGWRQKIKDDPDIVQVAAGRAQKAIDLLFSLDEGTTEE